MVGKITNETRFVWSQNSSKEVHAVQRRVKREGRVKTEVSEKNGLTRPLLLPKSGSLLVRMRKDNSVSIVRRLELDPDAPFHTLRFPKAALEVAGAGVAENGVLCAEFLSNTLCNTSKYRLFKYNVSSYYRYNIDNIIERAL